ncbi:hypothetical protein KUTeg_023499, partial [Tegillarca granosa]
MWRTVSFVERIEVDFCGNLFNEAIFVGDVDNDKAYELVVGNVDGDLAVFKGTSSSPWRKSSDLGMITCVGVGDIENKGKNMLVVLTAEGWCYIYDIKSDHSGEGEDSDKTLKPLFTQHLPANGKVLLIADVDGDGQTELVVGYADRVVRCFKWMSISDSETELTSNAKLIQCDKWQLSRQIGSLTLNIAADGKPELLVAQPGDVPLSSARSRNIGIKTEIGNGTDEVICCAWDGQTYIVNHSRDVVRYHLPQVESTNLIEVMDNMEETESLLSKLKLSNISVQQKRELYHWCLYVSISAKDA